MREVETDNSVIWPSWCYNNTGENRLDVESLKSKIINSAKSSTINKYKKKRNFGGNTVASISQSERMNGVSTENHCSTPSSFTNVSSGAMSVTTNSTNTTTMKTEVKTERLSPSSAITDNNSSGSGSNTPSSSYPGTPPGSNNHNDRVPSPSLSPASVNMPHPKMLDQPMARNYSDIMRSLAAKYNNSNPNDFYNTSSKNGLSGAFNDPRFSMFKTNPIVSPFVGPITTGRSSPPSALNSSCHLSPSLTNTKDSIDDLKRIFNITDAQSFLLPNFGLNSLSSAAKLPFFPPIVDFNSSQSLLNNIVRTSSTNSQTENSTKGITSKRHADSNPLDLSSANVQTCSTVKKKRISCNTDDNSHGESSPSVHVLDNLLRHAKDRSTEKRTGSISPSNPRNTKSLPFSIPGPVPSSQISVDENRTSTTCLSICSTLDRASCTSREDGIENILHWSVDDVHNFVSQIDLCAEYADNFREQSIDGMSLPLLTEDHLRSTINMKLGPALKFRAILAQKIGHCTVCMHCLHCHGRTGYSLTAFANNSPTHTTNRPNSTGN